ncbi:hypothetical protein [Mycolicibacterium sp. 018/SC-01/001]|uniref:hypothetical protein n=1 Tax=Mycolicibacterium sp. 018/SC-01/001 TaxID=2592069 RepID=UPI00163DE3D6|nr:hypothetical protein [Mycolicibacterium sp. 018/SC-01/001]
MLDWFTKGQVAAIKPEQMMSLLTMFPEEDLLAAPTRAPQRGHKPVPWSAGTDLIDRVQQRARRLDITGKARKEIGAAALELWLAANPVPTGDD